MISFRGCVGGRYKVVTCGSLRDTTGYDVGGRVVQEKGWGGPRGGTTLGRVRNSAPCPGSLSRQLFCLSGVTVYKSGRPFCLLIVRRGVTGLDRLRRGSPVSVVIVTSVGRGDGRGSSAPNLSTPVQKGLFPVNRSLPSPVLLALPPGG